MDVLSLRSCLLKYMACLLNGSVAVIDTSSDISVPVQSMHSARHNMDRATSLRKSCFEIVLFAARCKSSSIEAAERIAACPSASLEMCLFSLIISFVYLENTCVTLVAAVVARCFVRHFSIAETGSMYCFKVCSFLAI